MRKREGPCLGLQIGSSGIIAPGLKMVDLAAKYVQLSWIQKVRLFTIEMFFNR